MHHRQQGLCKPSGRAGLAQPPSGAHQAACSSMCRHWRPSQTAGTLRCSNMHRWGVLRFTVITDTLSFVTPPLLGVSYLEAVGAIIDLSTNHYSTPDGHTANMRRLSSGHRAIHMLDFDTTPLEIATTTSSSRPRSFPTSCSSFLALFFGRQWC